MTKQQRDITKKLKEGCRLIYFDHYGEDLVKVFENGRSAKVNVRIFRALLDKGLIKAVENDKTYEEYELC